MKKRLIAIPILLVLGLMVLMTLSYAGEKEKADVRDAIVSMNKNFVAAFNRGDAAGLASLYTENAQVLPPNSDFMTGKTAIQGFWQVLLDMGLKATLETVEVEPHGNTAIEVGKFTLQSEGGQPVDKGKYLVVWKQDGGQWKLHRDIFNSSMPVPEQAEK